MALQLRWVAKASRANEAEWGHAWIGLCRTVAYALAHRARAAAKGPWSQPEDVIDKPTEADRFKAGAGGFSVSACCALACCALARVPC